MDEHKVESAATPKAGDPEWLSVGTGPKLDATPWIKGKYPAVWDKVKTYLSLPYDSFRKLSIKAQTGEDVDEDEVFRRRVHAFNHGPKPLAWEEGIGFTVLIGASTRPGASTREAVIYAGVNETYARLTPGLVHAVAVHLNLELDQMIADDAFDVSSAVAAEAFNTVLSPCRSCGKPCPSCALKWSKKFDESVQPMWIHKYKRTVKEMMIASEAGVELSAAPSIYDLQEGQRKPGQAGLQG